MPDSVTVIGTPGLSPNSNIRTFAIALLFVACPDGYSGNGGVGINGCHEASAIVESLPSRPPLIIAGSGRQKLYSYFVPQQAILASPAAKYIRANTRAFSERFKLRVSITWVKALFQMAVGEARQNCAISLCSLVRVELSLTPICLISL